MRRMIIGALADFAYWRARRANKRASFWMRVGHWLDALTDPNHSPSMTRTPF